ncbi:hypothetical protein C8Q78DRAFT_975887 [Trametes maxima]|nr:hypothetical protein C8Q78DRAFT_975887 [Trametes maxima]
MDAPYAFTTLVTSVYYLPGALAVAAALKELHASQSGASRVSFQTVCLVTPETVDVSSVKLLRRAFDVVIGVEIIEQEDTRGLQLLGRPDLSHVLTKLHVFRLGQYSKVIFLDADVLPIRPISHLFEIPYEFAAVPDVGWPDIFNSGVLVLTPGEEKFNELTTLLKTKGTWDGGDQGILNEWRGGDWHRLSFTYNTTPTAAYTYAPAYERFGSEISAIHFIGPNKPWATVTYRSPGTKYGQTSNKTPGSTSSAYDYDSLVDRWYDVYDRNYRSTESPEQANFEFTHYDSVWDTGTGYEFGAEMGRSTAPPPPGGALGLDDLRKIAVEGINSYNASTREVEQQPKVGEYRSLPLNGRVDLMRPRKAAPVEEEQERRDAEKDQGEDQCRTPTQTFMVLHNEEPRMDTLPTPLRNDVPGAPLHGPLSLPASGSPTPHLPSRGGQPFDPYAETLAYQPSQQRYDDSEWPDSDAAQRWVRCQDIGRRKVIDAFGHRPQDSTPKKVSSQTIKTTQHPGSHHGKPKSLSVCARRLRMPNTPTIYPFTSLDPKAMYTFTPLQNVTTTANRHARVDSKVLPSFITSMYVTATVLLGDITPHEAFILLEGTIPLLTFVTPLLLQCIPLSLRTYVSLVLPMHRKRTTSRTSTIIITSISSRNRSFNRSLNTCIPKMISHLSWNPAIEPPPKTPPPISAFPADTYFPNVWDQAPGQEHDATHQSFPLHLPGSESETFFHPPPPAGIPEELLREGRYESVIGRVLEDSPGSVSTPPAPDPSKIHTIFPWEEKPRPAPRRVFPVSDSPPPGANFISAPPPPKPVPKHVHAIAPTHVSSPSIGLPYNLAFQNAWDTVPSIQRYATKLVRPHHAPYQPPPPDYDEGWRRWDQERERVYQERQDASSMDGDDEDEGDDEDYGRGQPARWDSESSRDRNQPRRSRAGSTTSITSVKGKKYRGRGIQTDRIETRSMGVQVSAWAEEVAASAKSQEPSKSDRGTTTLTRSWPPAPSGTGLLPPVTVPDSRMDPSQMAVAIASTAVQPPMSVIPFPSSASPTGLRSPQTLGSPRTYSPPRAASPLHFPSPPKLDSPKFITPPNVPSPRGPPSPRTIMSPRRLSSAYMPTSKLAGSPKFGLPVAGPSTTSSPRASPKLTRLASPPLQRTPSNDTVIASSPSTPGPVETPENTPVMGPRKGGRVWDPARGIDVFKRSSEEVLARFLRSGSFDEEEAQRRHV